MTKKTAEKYFASFRNHYFKQTYHFEKPELQKNVVLISIESLSAAYMKAYGYEESVTPFLDQLAQKVYFSPIYTPQETER